MKDTSLHLESPAMVCGHCRFAATVSGRWSVEDGRLVFRADANPQPRRGPDLHSCSESREVARITAIETETDQTISGAEFEALQRTAMSDPWWEE